MSTTHGQANTNRLEEAYQVKPQGLVLHSSISYEQWSSIGAELLSMAEALSWAIGDWLVYGEMHYPDRYMQAVRISRLSLSRLQSLCSVARSYAPDERVLDLSISHHEAAQALPAEQRASVLMSARAQDTSRDDLRVIVRELRGQAAPRKLVLVGRLDELRISGIPIPDEWLGLNVHITIQEAK